MLCFLLGIQASLAQDQLVGAGGNIIGPSGQMSFTVGQMAYSVQSSPSYSILVGIQQPGGVITFPIELLYFRASSKGSQVLLNWATASELNNNYFTVERSSEGLTWEVLEQIPSSGNSQEITQYKTIDKNPYAGVSYYRLKQTDLDGTFEYSDIASTLWDNIEIQIYPNPATDFLLLLANDNASQLRYVIYNAKGEEVENERVNSSETLIDIQKLSKGMYHIVISTETEILKSNSIIKN